MFLKWNMCCMTMREYSYYYLRKIKITLISCMLCFPTQPFGENMRAGGNCWNDSWKMFSFSDFSGEFIFSLKSRTSGHWERRQWQCVFRLARIVIPGLTIKLRIIFNYSKMEMQKMWMTEKKKGKFSSCNFQLSYDFNWRNETFLNPYSKYRLAAL